MTTSVGSAISGFFSKLKSVVATMWKKAPAIEVQAASAVNYVVPFVESLDEIILPIQAPAINLML